MAGLFRLLKSKWFPPTDPTESFQGKTILITGANTGLGYEAALKLALRGASRIILGVRSIEKGNDAKASIEAKISQHSTEPRPTIDVWPLDMNDYGSIQAFAARIEAEVPRLDVALLNAGVHPAQFQKSQYGWELGLQVNVLSTTLLALLLVPVLRRSRTEASIPVLEVVSSGLHAVVSFDEEKRKAANLLETYNSPEKFNGMDQYRATKLFITYVCEMLARQAQPEGSSEPDFHVVWICPGACASNLGRDYVKGAVAWIMPVVFAMFFKTAEEGARTYLLGITRSKEFHGKFVQDGGVYT
jgi:NAD(P)-dependent dehydrogenase (short-subunit alcohol dehydrogenase family)